MIIWATRNRIRAVMATAIEMAETVNHGSDSAVSTVN